MTEISMSDLTCNVSCPWIFYFLFLVRSATSNNLPASRDALSHSLSPRKDTGGSVALFYYLNHMWFGSDPTILLTTFDSLSIQDLVISFLSFSPDLLSVFSSKQLDSTLFVHDLSLICFEDWIEFLLCMCVMYRWEMAQILLHGNLHVTIYEVDKIGGGGAHGFLHKVFVLSFYAIDRCCC